MNVVTLDTLIKKLESYNPEEIEKVKKAYYYAETLHAGQMRASGEPYIIHPLNVASILADMHADGNTVCAGLLHDTLEDTKVTKEDLERDFNPVIASLVSGVTKMEKEKFPSKEAQNLANTRKIISGITDDVRIIIIKLADRLHNMRTLEFKSEQKQKENARETLEIFVPLAYYIGAYNIKNELEDLSLRYIEPDEYKRIEEKRNELEKENDSILEYMCDDIIKQLQTYGIPSEINYRIKNIYGMYKKMKKGLKVEDIHDLLALKVIVKESIECYAALGLIHVKYHPMNNRFKDYICNPKANNYRSLHSTVFGPEGKLVQTQIRTFEMDKTNTYGLTAYWDTQKGNAMNAMKEDLIENSTFYKSLKELAMSSVSDKEFIYRVKKEIFSEKVYVYISSGRTIELPKGSTTTDLARLFGINTDNTIFKGIVNNKVVPNNYELKTNDCVSIIIVNELSEYSENKSEGSALVKIM